jgi:hypothetical protein
MSAKILLLVGLVWFGAVVLWSFVGGFFIGIGHGKIAKAAAWSFVYLMQMFTFGWIVPLAIGAYRLIKGH